VRELTAAAERLAEGDLASRAPDSGTGGELGKLERSFNEMAASLERRLSEAQGGREASGEVLDVFARELRDSVSSALGYLDTLLADARGVEGIDAEERFHALEASRESARKALDLVNEQLLNGSTRVRSRG
jgi:signal transduction histidine kinase